MHSMAELQRSVCVGEWADVSYEYSQEDVDARNSG